MLAQLRVALFAVLALTVLTGILYPLLMTGAAQLFFPAQANGSLLLDHGKAAGSSLIGQPIGRAPGSDVRPGDGDLAGWGAE